MTHEELMGQNKEAMIKEMKTIMVERFAPALLEVLFERNPVLFEEHSGSCCNQMAILGAAKLYLLDTSLEYDWQVWEGVFQAKFRGEMVTYNHSWIIGIHSSGNHIYVDLAHRRDKRIFEETTLNIHPDAEKRGWKLLGARRMPWKSMVAQTEYYTGLSGSEVYELIERKKDATDEFCEKWYEALRPEDAD